MLGVRARGRGRASTDADPASACARGRSSGAAPIPTTPTRATSPSSSAFIACVVEKATCSTRRARRRARRAARRSASATPSLTPPAAPCGGRDRRVGAQPTGVASTATALVNVPPTSTPTRTGAARSRRVPPPRADAPRGARPAARRTRRPRRARRRRAAPPGPRSPRASGGCRSARRGRPAAAPSRVDRRGVDHVDLLERPHGVAGEGDREQQQDRGAADQHRLQRQLLPSPRIA